MKWRVFMVLVAISAGAPAGAGTLTDELRMLSPDSTEAWVSVARASPPTFRAAAESLLFTLDLRSPNERGRGVEAAKAYCVVTRDSVLFSDIAFLDKASADSRRAWTRAVALDRGGRTAKGSTGIPLLQQAIELYAGMRHLRREAVAWGSLGTAQRSAGDLARAEASYQHALGLRERLGDPLWVGNALNTIGMLKREQSDYDSALVYLERALSVREKIGNPNDIAKTLNALGDLHQQRQELNQAREFYDRALATLGAQASGELVLNAREGLANVESSQGNHAAALSAYSGVLAGWEAMGNDRAAANTRGNLASELTVLGRPVEALRELENAQRYFEAESLDPQLAHTLNAACLVQRDLGNLDQALILATEALRRSQSSGDVTEETRILMNLGLIHSELGASSRSLEYLNMATALADSLDDPVLRRDALSITGAIHCAEKDFQRALSCYEKALDLDRATGNKNKIAVDLVNIGMNKVGLGRREGMLELRQSIAIAESLNAPSILWKGMLNLADAYEVFGELDSARVENQRTIEVMESVQIGNLGEYEKADFLEQRSFVYEAQTNVLGLLAAREPGRGYELEAWKVAEQGKARALLDMLGEGSSGNASMDRAWKDVGRGASLDDVRRSSLKTDNDVILEYALGDSGSYVWAITKKSIALYRLPDKEQIQETSRRLRRALEDDVPGLRGRAPVPSQTPPVSWRDLAATLNEIVLAPVASSLEKASRIVIIPDGALHYVPFELLLRRSGLEERYALAGKTVLYAPSAGVLAQLSTIKHHQDVPKSFLGVGDPDFGGDPYLGVTSAVPLTETAFRSGIAGSGETRLPSLPHTREEVVGISHFFKTGQTTLLLGNEAREATLDDSRFLSQFRILHFATHGLTDERFPKHCCLALSATADSSTDGFLRAEEISRLPLKADLVVLSACETGKGKMVRGEGVLGLPRAFLYAGARNVVVSLWSVSDEGTAELMTSFYKEMVQGKHPPGEALARAKKEMIQSSKWNHPFYWAGFVLMGPGQ